VHVAAGSPVAGHAPEKFLAQVQVPVGQLISQLAQMLQVRIKAGVIRTVERLEGLPQHIGEVSRHLFRAGVLNSAGYSKERQENKCKSLPEIKINKPSADPVLVNASRQGPLGFILFYVVYLRTRFKQML